MSAFIKNPNLPRGNVTCMLIGEPYLPILAPRLSEWGISVIPVPENPDVAPPVRGHADLSVCYLGNGKMLAAEPVYIRLIEHKTVGFEMMKAEKNQSMAYPNDVSLNVAIIGNIVVLNDRYCDNILLKLLSEAALNRIAVKQGYTKCSICILSEQAVITADKGICSALRAQNLEVLLISPGHIILPGYDTGFIGGCCGKLSERRIAFTGHLNGHPDKARILDFIKMQQIEVSYLTDQPCFDVGSLLPVLEIESSIRTKKAEGRNI